MESSEGYGSGREVGASTINPSPQPKSTLHQVPCSATTAKARVVLKGNLNPQAADPTFLRPLPEKLKGPRALWPQGEPKGSRHTLGKCLRRQNSAFTVGVGVVVVVVVAATVHRRHLSCANWASGATLKVCNRLLCEA